MDAKQSIQKASEINTAETSLQEVSSKLSTLALKGDGATTSFDLSGKDPSDVSVVNDGAIHFRLNGKEACSARMEMGSIVYGHDSGATVAYQAGGVFKKQGGAASIVQSPTLEYRSETIEGESVRTLRFPMTNVSGGVSSSGEVTAKASSDTKSSLTEDLCLTGASTDEIDVVRQVNVTVTDSSFADAWEQYLVEEFGRSNVTVDDGDVTAVVPLGSGVAADQFPVNDAKLFGGVYIGSAAGELLIKTPNVEVNSYDSEAVTGGAPAYRNSGDIYTRGDVTVKAQSHINGSVFSEGTVELDNSCQINGAGAPPGKERCVTQDVHFNNTTGGGLLPASESERADAIGGAWTNGTVVPELDPMDATIESTVGTVSETNHNDSAPVADGEITYTSGTATLDNGVYYLDELTVPTGSTLTIDTTNGDVVLAVAEDVTVGADGTLRVTGDGQVRTFVNGTSGDQLNLQSNAVVEARESGSRTYRSEAFFVVCKAGCEATVGQNARFTGVLYGPGTDASSGTVDLQKDSTVWGALVAGTVDFSKQSTFHFDTQLRNAGLDSDGDGVRDSEDDNNFPDSDNDGVPDDVDECDVAGDGVNGCPSVTEDESRNALVVNQPRAEITVVGTMVADEKTITREVGEREPLDVQFAIDDSGSMAWEEAIGGWYSVDVLSGNEVWGGETWRLHDDETGKMKWVAAGETFDDSKWDTFYRFEIGNDPYDKRVDATKTFIGSLNDSLDEVGVYLFDSDVTRAHFIRSAGSDFDGANESVETVTSTGSTNIAQTIVEATDDYNPSTDDEKVIVLLTDGQHNENNPTIPGSGEAEVRWAAEYAHENGITIYTVALGDGADADLLKDIANTDDEDTDGARYKANDYTELTEIFDKIAGEATKQTVHLVEYKDTQVTVNVGGSAVTLSGNANTPTDDTRPSKVVDIAELRGADDDEIEQYVGTLLSAQATTRECDDTDSFDTISNGGTEYDEVTCDGTSGVFDQVTNSSSNHEIFVDGESVPSASEFEAGWFKKQSFRGVIADYESDTGKAIIDDSTGTFDLGANDAIIVVKTNTGDGDTDYVVLHFEAKDGDVDYDTNSSDTESDVIADTDLDSSNDNDYVIDISQTTVEVGNESDSMRPIAANAPARIAAVGPDAFTATNPASVAVSGQARSRDH